MMAKLKGSELGIKTSDVIDMLVDSCEEVYKDQAGLDAGNTITRLIFHAGDGDDKVDVKEIRNAYGLTQDQFASVIRMTPSTVRQWEQGLRTPKGTSKIVLEAMAIVAKKKADNKLCSQNDDENKVKSDEDTAEA